MNVAIFGASGQGRVTLDLMRAKKGVKVIAFLDDDRSKWKHPFCSLPVLGGKEQLTELKKKYKIHGIVLAIGEASPRKTVYEACEKAGLKLLGFVHPAAVVSPGATVDSTAMIWPNAVVHVGARLGKSVIVNTSAIVEHDTNVGDFVHLAPGSVLCGECTIGNGTWIGAGTVVIQQIQIGHSVMIGAGSVVTKSIPDKVVAFGVPCKIR